MGSALLIESSYLCSRFQNVMDMKILIKREQRKRVCFAESEKSRTKFKNFALILMSLLMVCCTKDDEVKAQTMTQKMYITIDGQAQAVTLVDNQATKTLVEKLQQASVTVTLSGQRLDQAPAHGIYIENGIKKIAR